MKTKHLLLSMIILAALALFSCEGIDDPNDPLNPNGSDTTSIVDTTVIVVIDSTIIVTQNITESVTWKSGIAYIIDGAIRVGSSENVVLTIEPGVVVRFNKDASLAFAYSSGTFASVKALGTAINPIIFEPNTSDAWKCVAFFEGALDCEFENCSFAGGGSNDYYGNLYISETQVAFTKCVFNQSASSGIKLDGTGGFSAFAYNTLSNIADYPIEIGTSQIHTIGESNTFETGERIYINDNNFSDAGDYLWRNHSIPYLIDGGMRIGSENTQGVNISVEEATEFNFTTGSYIDFAYSDDTYATFIAKGSVDDPIVFTSASPSKNAGDWSSLRFYKGAINCELDYCNFSYGGKNSSYGMVYLDEYQ